MEFRDVKSSLVKAVAYDPESKTMIVIFVRSGKKYRYENVPAKEYEDFVTAPSVGIYFNRVIRKAYPGVELKE